MRKCFFSLVFVMSAVFNISFAVNICMDLDRQEVIATPELFSQQSFNMSCGWKNEAFVVNYMNNPHWGSIEKADYHLANIIALENSKAMDDYLFDGDDDDPNYIDNHPFIVPEKEGLETFVIALEVQYLHQTEVLLSVLNAVNSYTSLSCIDRTLQNNAADRMQYRNVELLSYLKEILRSDQCQKAIETFNIPLTLEDIDGLKPAEGFLN